MADKSASLAEGLRALASDFRKPDPRANDYPNTRASIANTLEEAARLLADRASMEEEIGALTKQLSGLAWVVEIYDGKLTAADLANELADLKMVSGEVSVVYDRVTGGRISKPTTRAFEVISQFEHVCSEDINEAVKEACEERDDEIGALKSLLSRAVEALGGLEWANYDIDVDLCSCPSCGGSERTGHTAICSLSAVLSEINAALKGEK